MKTLPWPMVGLLLILLAMNSRTESAPPQPRGRVIGIGGVFFKSPHPKDLSRWYETHLGFTPKPVEGVVFPWTTPGSASPTYRTTWAVFPQDTRYFDPAKSSLMVNYVVDDLDAILRRLEAEGIRIDPKRETDAAGKFAWVFDSDGNKIELWEPAAQAK